MRNLCLLIFVTVLQTDYAFAQTSIDSSKLKIVRDSINTFIKKYNIPGTQITVSREKSIIYNEGFGYASFGRAITINNLFRIASLTKLFTAIAILQLCEVKKLTLNDTIFGKSGLLGNYNRLIDPRLKDITVRMLLNHTGGWDRRLSGDPTFKPIILMNISNSALPLVIDSIISYTVQNEYLDYRPGSTYAYSNFGYLLLGKIIEKISGIQYSDFIDSHILKKAKITDMELGKTFPDSNSNEVFYFDYPGASLVNNCYDTTKKVLGPYGGFDMSSAKSFAGWIASSNDIVKCLLAIPDLLSKESTNIMSLPPLKNDTYGMAINVNDSSWWHNGNLPGATSGFLHTFSGYDCCILCNTGAKDEGKINNDLINLLRHIIQILKQ